MYRVCKLAQNFYGCKINDLEDDLENLQEFVDSGDIVILGSDIDDIAEILSIDSSDIIMR